jgi:hypothetical protein
MVEHLCHSSLTKPCWAYLKRIAFSFLSDKCSDYRYLLFIFLLLYQKNVAHMPVFAMHQVAHLQPILKSGDVKFPFISRPKTEVNHGVENDAG